MIMSSVKQYIGFGFLVGMALTILAIASSSSIMVVADASDTAAVNFTEGDANITFIGFSSVPVILEVSNSLTPQLLSGVETLGQEDPYGAYLGVNTAVELHAAGEQGITQIESLTAL